MTRDLDRLARLRSGLPALALAVALLLVLAACGGTTRDDEDADGGGDAAAETETEEEADEPAEEEEEEEEAEEGDGDAEIPEGLSVAFLPKQVNNPYFDIAAAGGEEAVGEFAGEFEQTGPSEASASSQVSYINTLSQQGADVIVTSANDPNAVCGALEEARTAGAAIVTYDSDTDPECRDVFVNQATAEGIAEVQLELIAEQIGGAGEIAVLSATANATNQNAWIELMEEELASNPDYADIELVTIAYGDDEDEKSFQETQGLLQSYPDLAGIVSPTTVGVAAAARYLSGSEYQGAVALTGLGTPNQMREFVNDGTVTAFALWNPEDLGYLAAYTAGALASGQISGSQGDAFEAGKLGSTPLRRAASSSSARRPCSTSPTSTTSTSEGCDVSRDRWASHPTGWLTDRGAPPPGPPALPAVVRGWTSSGRPVAQCHLGNARVADYPHFGGRHLAD